MTSQQDLKAENGGGPGRHRRAWNLRGVLRLLVYSLVVSVLLAGLATRSAYGDLKESAMILGRQLASVGDLTGTTYRVRLNGEPIYVSSAPTDQPVEQVLDRFETACREHAGGLAEMFARLPAALQSDLRDLEGNQGMGIVRQTADGEGMVACLAQEQSGDWVALTSRLTEFVDTGDLSKVGNLRYVYAASQGGRTQVLTVWTEGPFRITSIAPMDGQEAPGTDSEHAPRPLDAVRLMSATVEGSPYAVRIYDSAQGEQQVLGMYDEQMPSRGWIPLQAATREAPNARAFTREGVDLLVFAYPQGGKSYVSVVEMQPR